MLSTVGRLLHLDNLARPDSLVQQGKHIWKEWVNLATSQDHVHETTSIALVGKYTTLHDAYLSVSKALEHAAMHCKKKLKVIWVDASNLEEASKEKSLTAYHEAWHKVCTADGILVPGGFGERGTEGMIRAINYARTKKIPFLGICLGMQLAVIEFARNVANLENAGSEELNPECENKAVIFMPEVSSSPPKYGALFSHLQVRRVTRRSRVAPCALESVGLCSSRALSGRASAPFMAPRRRSGSDTATDTR